MHSNAKEILTDNLEKTKKEIHSLKEDLKSLQECEKDILESLVKLGHLEYKTPKKTSLAPYPPEPFWELTGQNLSI